MSQYYYSVKVYWLTLYSGKKRRINIIIKDDDKVFKEFTLLTYKLTSDLPINCICAVILVIICTDTSRLPEDQNSSLTNLAFGHLLLSKLAFDSKKPF